ncbi:MAG: OmpA family protein [Thermodesulfobacteriota bacterium]|nr:OmpA family protein [Thermodesulfobacteriota bacterium]
MSRISMILALCCACLFLSSCLFPTEYLRIESDLKNANQLLKHKEVELKNIQQKLKETEACRSQCATDLAGLKSHCQDLEHMNIDLSRKAKGLNLEVKKKDSIIRLHKKVIRLLDDAKKTIENSLKEQIELEIREASEEEANLKFVFPGRVLFASGCVDISEKGKEVLIKTAPSLRMNKSKRIIVEGHTDNLPVRSSGKEDILSNWDLSTRRAVSVVRFLAERLGIESERLSAVGYSHYRPVASNSTEEGRSQNRRIEIILCP